MLIGLLISKTKASLNRVTSYVFSIQKQYNAKMNTSHVAGESDFIEAF